MTKMSNTSNTLFMVSNDSIRADNNFGVSLVVGAGVGDEVLDFGVSFVVDNELYLVSNDSIRADSDFRVSLVVGAEVGDEVLKAMPSLLAPMGAFESAAKQMESSTAPTLSVHFPERQEKGQYDDPGIGENRPISHGKQSSNLLLPMLKSAVPAGHNISVKETGSQYEPRGQAVGVWCVV